MDEFSKKIGERLRTCRLAAGLTQAQLAKKIGIGRPIVARAEGGRVEPKLSTLCDYAEALDVPLALLVIPVDPFEPATVAEVARWLEEPELCALALDDPRDRTKAARILSQKINGIFGVRKWPV